MLADEDVSVCDDGASSAEDVAEQRCNIIRNTFIHIAAPTLPQHGARRRAQSLPKNIRIMAATRSSSPCSPSRRSWADEDPSDFSLDEGTWDSAAEEVNVQDVSDSDTGASTWEPCGEELSREWKGRDHNCGLKGKWNSHGQWEQGPSCWDNRAWRRWDRQTSSSWRWS